MRRIRKECSFLFCFDFILSLEDLWSAALSLVVCLHCHPVAACSRVGLDFPPCPLLHFISTISALPRPPPRPLVLHSTVAAIHPPLRRAGLNVCLICPAGLQTVLFFRYGLSDGDLWVACNKASLVRLRPHHSRFSEISAFTRGRDFRSGNTDSDTTLLPFFSPAVEHVKYIKACQVTS